MVRVVAVVALLAAVTASQPPPPTPAKTGQAQQEQARAAQEQTKTDDQSAKKPVPAVPQSSPEITVGYEQRFGDQDKNSSAWRDWPAWAVAAFTLGLLIVAILQWAAMHGQRKLMGDQLAEMKTTSADTHALAVAAQSQIALLAQHVDAAGKAADAAAKSADAAAVSVEITRLLERPWVSAALSAHTHLSFDRDGPWITPLLTLKNVGHSVATEVRYACKLVPALFGALDAKHTASIYKGRGRGGRQTLLPGEISTQVVPLSLRLNDVDPEYIRSEDGEELISLGIICVVTYEFPMSAEEHSTLVSYAVGRYEHDKARIVVKIGEQVPSDLLTFLKEPIGSYAS